MYYMYILVMGCESLGSDLSSLFFIMPPLSCKNLESLSLHLVSLSAKVLITNLGVIWFSQDSISDIVIIRTKKIVYCLAAVSYIFTTKCLLLADLMICDVYYLKKPVSVGL